MKNYLPLPLLLCLVTAVIYISCSKGGSDAPAPPANPCAGVTVGVTGTVTNASTGQNNGAITVTASGGSGFTYSLNSGAFQSSATFSGLAAGNYTITAKNSNGCTGSAQFTVTTTNACTGVTINVSGATTAAVPCGAPNGSLTVTASGSTGLMYSINGGAFQAGNVFSNLAANNYNITVRDANGCTGSAAAVVGTAAAGPLFAAVRSIVQTNCALSGCHAGAAPQNGINFANDCDIVAQSVRIKARAVDANPSIMPPPPNAQLSAAQKTAITNWVNAGGGYTN